MKKIKLIACDMDGTLLDDNKNISEANIEAVRRLKDEGVIFVIATGRHDTMILGYLDDLNIEMPVISCNGALVREPFSNRVFTSIPMSSTQVIDIAEVCKQHKADYHIYCRNIIFGETMTNKMIYYRERNLKLPERDQIPLHVSRDHREFIESSEGELFKVLIIPEDSDDSRSIDKGINLKTGLILSQSDTNLFDVMQKGVSKSHAMGALCSEMSIGRDETAAIGDQSNDLDMIRYAGIGVAVRNAVPEVKDAASFTTLNSNNDSGVAEALDRLVFSGNR